MDKLHIVCPHCHAANRVPADRLGDAPTCGKCKSALFPGEPLTLSTATFDQHISRSDIPVLVDFWAPWCGPCQMMAPAFAAAAAQLEPQMRLAKVDTQAEPALGSRFGIRSIPTLAIFREGSIIASQAGAMPESSIVQWARQHIST